MEALVSAQPWYQGGYRAQVVAYGIAKLAHDLRLKRKFVDFESIWRLQDLPSGLVAALTVAAEEAHAVLTNPIGNVRNVTEWAKKEACWTRLQSVRIDWPAETWACTIGDEEVKIAAKSAKKDQKVLKGIQAQIAVVGAGASFWKEVLDWAITNKHLSLKERDIIGVATAGQYIPSENQSEAIIAAFEKLRGEGFPTEIPQRTA
jgi:hypothetical protein